MRRRDWERVILRRLWPSNIKCSQKARLCVRVRRKRAMKSWNKKFLFWPFRVLHHGGKLFHFSFKTKPVSEGRVSSPKLGTRTF